MEVQKGQVFNLLNTNGRNQSMNTLQGFLTVLKDVTNNNEYEWKNFQNNSFVQFNFYKKTIELFPDTFKKHEKYDLIIKEIKENPKLDEAFKTNNIQILEAYKNANKKKYKSLLKKIDTNVELRARNYTSTLNDIGFVDSKRNISKIGEAFLDPKKIKRDELEKFLPIDNINIIYLRQLLKLRIFDKQGKNYYYSPFCFALYLLTRNSRINENTFLELIQGSNPYNIIHDIETYVSNYKDGDIINNMQIDIPQCVLTDNMIEYEIFKKIFKNQKSSKQINTYWNFYSKLFQFNTKRNEESLNDLLDYYKSKQDVLKKAFGYGKNVFLKNCSNRQSVQEFLKNNMKLFKGNINENIYQAFTKSKQLDSIHEYKDTTKRIFKATGIISFKNGYVELVCKELLSIILASINIETKIWGDMRDESNSNFKCYEDYEDGVRSYFRSTYSLSEIFELSNKDIENISDSIKTEYNNKEIKNIHRIIKDKRKKEFSDYIELNYPVEKVENLLRLFKDRSNDKKIKKYVSTDASVSTIYEYIIGIAWYYFSGKKIDLLSSFNLTLSADFEPLIYAGGGQGDIIIYESDKVVMLEATLMNANSQKRGEWEPVLRHSINLKIEEEKNKTNRNVVTFFIADSFDQNTINIWKAVASVPLKSTTYNDAYTNNVIIMPLNNDELIQLLNKANEYDNVISKVRELFNTGKTNFDLKWRDKFIQQIMKKN